METGLYIWKIKNKLLIIFISFLFLSCTNVNKNNTLETIPNQVKLTNGVLVCRLGNGFFSDYFRKYASKEKRFSHIGIISIENGEYFVYHTEASELTGVGFVKKESLISFLDGIKIYEFFEMKYSERTKSKILENVYNYYIHKTPFDLSFDSSNDSELYCTELIATSINNALNKEIILPTLILNGKKIFSLDDIYLNENVEKLTFANKI